MIKQQTTFVFYPKDHKTLGKETVKVLFMYVMIHKLDLYINIAFYPDKD